MNKMSPSNYLYDGLKRKLYYYKGRLNGDVVPFDDEFYKKLENVIISSIPVSMHIKYLRPLTMTGKCYDRSLYMFYCFPDSVLVRGNLKTYEDKYGKEGAGHGWVEHDGHVYDPTTMEIYDLDLYYKLNQPYDVNKCNLEEYLKIGTNNNTYSRIINTKVEDFKKGGNQRYELITFIPLLESIAFGNAEFITDLNNWKEKVEYDAISIQKEMDTALRKLDASRRKN